MKKECFKNSSKLHTEFRIVEKDEGFRLTDDFEIHYIQLPFVDDKIELGHMDKLTEWMTFIRDVHIPEKRRLIEEIAKKEEVIGLAFAEYEKMNSNKETRRLYEGRLKQLRDHDSEVYFAEKKGREEIAEKTGLDVEDVKEIK